MAGVGKGNKAITVILSVETYEEVKELAQDKDWSVSQTARNLIEKALKK